MAGGDAGMEITKKILEINKKNKTTKNKKEETKTEINKTGAGIPKINPFLKKKRRNKSVLAAARQMRASRKMKVRMALLSKQKAIDFLSNLKIAFFTLFFFVFLCSVCMHVCVCICECVYVSVCVYMSMCVCVYECMCMCMYLFV